MKHRTSLLVIIISLGLITTGGLTNLLIYSTIASSTPQPTDPTESDHLDSTITRLMAVSQISALSSAIVHNGSIAWTRGYGLSNRETNTEATPETIYLVASI